MSVHVNVLTERIIRIILIAMQVVVISAFDQMDGPAAGTQYAGNFRNQGVFVTELHMPEKITAEYGVKTAIGKRQLIQRLLRHDLIITLPGAFGAIWIQVDSCQMIGIAVLFERQAVRSASASEIKHPSPLKLPAEMTDSGSSEQKTVYRIGQIIVTGNRIEFVFIELLRNNAEGGISDIFQFIEHLPFPRCCPVFPVPCPQ